MASLIPNLDVYIQSGLNVLLSGPHGVGKTQVLMEAAANHNLKVKYYSCATLDPFTDLVGIPYPVSQNGERRHLEMVRPRDVDEANIIVFDELNRAQDSKTLNAVLEIVQFRTINGEPLPNLLATWAAVNPPDEEYQVHNLDPALVDRFDIYFDVKPKVDVTYLSQRMDKQIAMALQSWWKDNDGRKNAAYVSPRRIEKIGLMVQKTRDTSAVKAMLPPGETFDHGKLIEKLKTALGQGASSHTGLAGPANPNLTYTRSGLLNNAAKVEAALKEPNCSQATIDNISTVLSTNCSPAQLVASAHGIIEALPQPVVEAMFNSWGPAKQNTFQAEWGSALAQGTVTKVKPWESGSTTASSSPQSASNQPLLGMKFVITGTIGGVTRQSAEGTLVAAGGRVSGSVTSSTSYLIMGSSGQGGVKLQAARSNGVRGVRWSDVLDAIRTNDSTHLAKACFHP